MKINIKLEAFEGPMDLLLHLIEKNKVSIYDIPIVEITDQYMEYIRELELIESMESISEFLVMAATLLKIKSKWLIPQEQKEEEEDPREELVQRLVEYKMYKYAAGELKDLNVDAEKKFYKPETVPKEIKEYMEPINLDEIVGDITLDKLNRVFSMVMRRKKDREDPVRSKFGKIQQEPYKVEDRMDDIQKQVKGFRHINFRTLLDIQPDKEMVIVTFLAVLELMKIGKLQVVQEENFEDIFMTDTEVA